VTSAGEQHPRASAARWPSAPQVAGHLMEHDFAEEAHRKWNRCDPVELFTAPIQAQVRRSCYDSPPLAVLRTPLARVRLAGA
jgi:hypothetical protein